MSELTRERPHEVLGHLGLRAVAASAQIRLNIDVQAEPMSLLVTTQLMNDDVLVSRSVRHLPKEHPPESSAIVRWFWHVLEDNLLTLLIGPELQRIPRDLFKDFFVRSLIVVPEAPPPSLTAEIVDQVSYEPPTLMKVGDLHSRPPGGCPVRITSGGGYGMRWVNLWDERRSIVASIPMHDSFSSFCAPEALYVHGRMGSDTYTIERYDFDGTLRWRRSVRFPSPFEQEVTILPSSLRDVDGRASAVLNMFDYQYV